MSILGILVMLVVICLVFWAVRALLGAFAIGEPIATLIYVVLVILIVLWLLSAIGGVNLGGLSTVKVH